MVLISNSQFTQSDGGPIYLDKTGANISNSSFVGLSLVKSSAVISSLLTRMIILKENKFSQIAVGSVIQLHGTVEEHHGSCIIERNLFQTIRAWSNGGAIQAIESGQLNIQQNYFESIRLLSGFGKGGAIYIVQRANKTNYVIDNQFVECSADMSGAIQWIQREPVIRNNSFTQVSAKYYGPEIGSYGKKISFIPTEIGQTLFTGKPQIFSLQGDSKIYMEGLRSGAELPTIYAGVMDQYNQIVISSQGGVLYSAAKEVLGMNQKYSGYPPLLSNNNENSWINGVVKIENLKLIGQPGRTYQILFTSPIIDTSLPAVQSYLDRNKLTAIQISLQVSFRECLSGQEFLPEGECRQCPPNFYLLEAPRSPTSCKTCPENAVCFGGNQIGPIRGYWRSNTQSETISPCFNFDGCLGTFPDQDYNPQGTCGKGYTGKLCGSCEPGYTRNTQYQCTKCPKPFANFLILFALLILLVFIFVIAIKCSLRSALKKKSLFTVYFKILVNHLQVLMLISSFDFDWPSEVQTFLAASKTVTDTPQQLFSIDCLVQSSIGRPFKRFYIYSLIYFFLPIMCAAFSYFFWKVKYSHNNKIMCNKFIATLFIIFFLIHPSVTRVILQLFDCHKIDGTQYLKEELSEQCWQGDQLRFSMTVGLLGIACWSVGIPFLSAFLLRRNRKRLEEPAIKEKFGFLYNGYTLRSYYWETFMSLRKVLIAFISIFLTSQGTMLQSLVLFIVLIVSIFINFKVNPYYERKINRLEIVSLIALIVTVYCGIFFLSARNPSKLEYIRGKDFTLSEPKRWILFFSIILSNGLFAGLWMLRLVQEVKVKLLKRFPSCYKFFCLCCNRRKLMKEQKVASSTEKNKDLIERLEAIRYELGTYIDRLESNENMIEINILDEMANEFKNTLTNISDWRDRSKNMTKQTDLKTGSLNIKFEDLQAQDYDTIESALSTRRPLNTNTRIVGMSQNSNPPLRPKYQQTSFKPLSHVSTFNRISIDNMGESMKSKETLTLDEDSQVSPVERETEPAYLDYTSPTMNRRPSLFQKILINSQSTNDLGKRRWNPHDDKLDLDNLEEQLKINEANKQQEISPGPRSFTRWADFLKGNQNHIQWSKEERRSKVHRRKSNQDSKIALFTKVNLDKEDSF